MSINSKSGYKIIFLVGLLLGFASIFLDWYYLQGTLDSGETIVSHIYNVLLGWSTPFGKENAFNDFYAPQNAVMPVVIIVVFIVLVFLSAYSALFHDVEKGDNLIKVKRFGFIAISLVTLIGFFVLVFPLFFLLPNGLYYPFMVYYDYELELTLSYSIGPGYLFQVIAFGCTFPYAMFNQSVLSNFEKEKFAPAKVIQSYIESSKESFDLDKLIAQEEFEIESANQLKRKKKPKSEVGQIFEEFLSSRGKK